MFQYKRKKNKNNNYYYLKIDKNGKKQIISKNEYYRQNKKGGKPNNIYKFAKFMAGSHGCPNELKDKIAKYVICDGFTIYNINKKENSNNSEKSTKILSYNNNYLENSNKINEFIKNLIKLFAIIQIYAMISFYNSGKSIQSSTRNYNKFYNENLTKEEFIKIAKDGILTSLNQLKTGGINISGTTNILNYETVKTYKNNQTPRKFHLYDLIITDYKDYIDFYNNNFNKNGFFKDSEIYEYLVYDNNQIKLIYVLKNPDGLIISLNEFIDVIQTNFNNGLDGVYYTNIDGIKYQSFYPFSGMNNYKTNGKEKKHDYTFNGYNIHTNNDINPKHYNNMDYTLGPLIKDFDDSYLYKYNHKFIINNKTKFKLIN
jgi:hypothetical protein